MNTATQMLISDDHTFPSQFQWEPLSDTKDFRTSGTKYVYAKFKDASGNESAIAFVGPPRIMYIQKSATLVSRPILVNVRVGSYLSVSTVKTFYHAIGSSSYTQLIMALKDGIYSAWIPAWDTSNGIEYYFQVEDASGNVIATLPESNPSSQPLSMPAASLLQNPVQAGEDNVLELAAGIVVEFPANAISSDTDLQVSGLNTFPVLPEGITATDVGYNFVMADGTTTFLQPVYIILNYSGDSVAKLAPRAGSQ